MNQIASRTIETAIGTLVSCLVIKVIDIIFQIINKPKPVA